MSALEIPWSGALRFALDSAAAVLAVHHVRIAWRRVHRSVLVQRVLVPFAAPVASYVAALYLGWRPSTPVEVVFACFTLVMLARTRGDLLRLAPAWALRAPPADWQTQYVKLRVLDGIVFAVLTTPVVWAVDPEGFWV